MFLSARSGVVLLRHCGTVLPRARAGTNAAMAPIPFAVIALAMLIAPAMGGANPAQSTASLRAQDAAIVAKSRAAVLGLYSLDQQLSVAQSKLASLRAQAESLRLERQSLRHQLAVATRSRRISQTRRRTTTARALRARQRRAARDPARLDESRRGDDESRQPRSRHGPGRGHPARARRRATGDRPLLTRARRANRRARVRDPRCGGNRCVAVRDARAAKLVHLVPVRAAPDDRRPDREPRRGSERSPGSQRSVPAEQHPGLLRARQPGAHRVGHGLRVAGQHRERPSRRLGRRRSRSIGDPARHTHDDPGYGDAVAADRGGSIVGATIDLWFPTVAQAEAWGRRTVTIVLH